MRTKAFMENTKKYKVIAKIFANGKVTIPMEIRDYLGLRDGDYVELIVGKIDMSVPSDT